MNNDFKLLLLNAVLQELPNDGMCSVFHMLLLHFPLFNNNSVIFTFFVMSGNIHLYFYYFKTWLQPDFFYKAQ